MNEDLAIAILEIITKGESFGFMPIFNEVRQLPEFFELTQPDFTITWNKLKEIDCLLRHEHGRDCVKLNPDKNCLTFYINKKTKKYVTEQEKQGMSIKIDGDVIGSIVGNQDLEQARISPTIHTTRNAPRNSANKMSLLEKTGWVLGILASLFAIWEFILKRLLNIP